MLEKKLKEEKESLKKYIEEMEYNSLLEKLLKNKAK